jgi:hypothetical protein
MNTTSNEVDIEYNTVATYFNNHIKHFINTSKYSTTINIVAFEQKYSENKQLTDHTNANDITNATNEYNIIDTHCNLRD